MFLGLARGEDKQLEGTQTDEHEKKRQEGETTGESSKAYYISPIFLP
jgi:hypothetical protein